MEQPVPKKRKRRSIWPDVAAIAAVLAVWGGLVYGGFYYATQYIDNAMKTVQDSNALQIQALEERMETLSAEMEAVEEALLDTGKTLESSDTTREALSERIEDLDEQLQRLERSLNTLKEAPNAQR